jgi:hypothetical protein
MDRRQVSLCVMGNVTWTNLDPLASILHFFMHFGLQLGGFAVSVKQWLDHCEWLVLQYRQQTLLWYSGEVGRSTFNSRYNNDPRTLPWSRLAFGGESSVYSVSVFTRNSLLCKQDFRTRK